MIPNALPVLRCCFLRLPKSPPSRMDLLYNSKRFVPPRNLLSDIMVSSSSKWNFETSSMSVCCAMSNIYYTNKRVEHRKIVVYGILLVYRTYNGIFIKTKSQWFFSFLPRVTLRGTCGSTMFGFANCCSFFIKNSDKHEKKNADEREVLPFG